MDRNRRRKRPAQGGDRTHDLKSFAPQACAKLRWHFSVNLANKWRNETFDGPKAWHHVGMILISPELVIIFAKQVGGVGFGSGSSVRMNRRIGLRTRSLSLQVFLKFFCKESCQKCNCPNLSHNQATSSWVMFFCALRLQQDVWITVSPILSLLTQLITLFCIQPTHHENILLLKWEFDIISIGEQYLISSIRSYAYLRFFNCINKKIRAAARGDPCCVCSLVIQIQILGSKKFLMKHHQNGNTPIVGWMNPKWKIVQAKFWLAPR